MFVYQCVSFALLKQGLNERLGRVCTCECLQHSLFIKLLQNKTNFMQCCVSAYPSSGGHKMTVTLLNHNVYIGADRIDRQ